MLFSLLATYLGAIMTAMTELLEVHYCKQQAHGEYSVPYFNKHDPYDKYVH